MQQESKKPKITVCIPTWNRSKFLNWQLTQFRDRKDEIQDWEFVVSDNASTDDTQSVVLRYAEVLNIKYHKMHENIGGESNLRNSYRMASAEYVIYLADDDMLDISMVNGYVEALIKNPQVSALYAPWYLKDVLSEGDGEKFYHHSGNKGIQKGDYSGLADFVLDNKIFPEILIAKKNVVENRINGHRFSFVYFAWLIQSINVGDLIFAEKPFYFSLINHPAGEAERLPAGAQQAMDSWDGYRGGFEVLLDLAARKGHHGDFAKMTLARSKLDVVVVERMLVALRLNIHHGNFLDAYWIYLRLGASTGMQKHLIDFETICGLACLDYICQNNGVKGRCRLTSDVPENVRNLALRFSPKKYVDDSSSDVTEKIGFDGMGNGFGFGDAYALLSVL